MSHYCPVTADCSEGSGAKAEQRKRFEAAALRSQPGDHEEEILPQSKKMRGRGRGWGGQREGSLFSVLSEALLLMLLFFVKLLAGEHSAKPLMKGI